MYITYVNRAGFAVVVVLNECLSGRQVGLSPEGDNAGCAGWWGRIRLLEGPGCLQVQVDLGWTKAVASMQRVKLGPVPAHGDPGPIQNVSALL